MMAEIITLTDKSGGEVQFVKDDPKSGAIKDVYFSPDRSYVVAFFRKPLNESARRRIEKIVGEYYDRIFNRTGGEYWRNVFCWPDKIVEYIDENEKDPNLKKKIGIVMPAYGKEFFFESGQEKECKWWGSAKNFNRFVNAKEKGTLRGFIHACLELSRAIRRMHLAGLAHSDLSYKNCLLDPITGRACLIDVDGLVVPELFPPDVLGTRDFMAPEIVAASKRPKEEKILPNSLTDLHALAVLIYLCVLHRHPLRGSKIHSADPDEQELLEMGEGALFIEHPTDASNRRVVEKGEEASLPWIDVEQLPYSVCGPYMKALFDRAFIKGLHSPYDRPSAAEWEDALAKTLDLILPCANPKCVKHEFVYDGRQKPVCPYCGTAYKESAPIFEYFSSRNGVDYLSVDRLLVASEGKELFEWHIDRNVAYNEKLRTKQRKRVGYFSKVEDDWFLHNERIENLYDLTEQRAIPIGESVKLVDNMRLSLFDEQRSFIVQVRIANKLRHSSLGDASMALSVELADADAKMESSRIEDALVAFQCMRLPLATVGKHYQYKLSLKNLRDAAGKNVSLSILEARGFDEFGLDARVEKDALIFEGVPTKEYNGRVELYVNGRFKSVFKFKGKTPIPGVFRFSNVHLVKTLTIAPNIIDEPTTLEESPIPGATDDAPLVDSNPFEADLSDAAGDAPLENN